MSVALLFTEASYATGISSVETLFKSQYPSTTLQIVKYTVEITPESVDKALDDYFATYPTGDNRSTLSHETLLAIKFEKNLVTFSYSQSQEVEVNVSEIIPNRFYSAVDPATQLFSILGRIFECGVCPPRVNSTMSKKTQLFYI